MLASRSIRRPVGNGWLAITCLVILAAGVFGGIKASMETIGNYQYSSEKTLTETSTKTQS